MRKVIVDAREEAVSVAVVGMVWPVVVEDRFHDKNYYTQEKVPVQCLPNRLKGGGPCLYAIFSAYRMSTRRVPVPILGFPCEPRIPGPLFSVRLVRYPDSIGIHGAVKTTASQPIARC